METNQPMELKFTMSREQAEAYFAWQRNPEQKSKGRLWFLKLWPFALLAVFSMTWIWHGEKEWMIAGVAFLTSVCWVILLLWYARKAQKKMLEQSIGNRIVRVEEEGLRVISTCRNTLTMWAGVTRAKAMHGGYVRVQFYDGEWFLPPHAFTSEIPSGMFVSEICRRTKTVEVVLSESAPQNAAAGYLTALAIGYFIAAGIMAFFTLASGFLTADVQPALTSMFGPDTAEDSMARIFGYGMWVFWGLELAITVTLLLAGFNLLRRKARHFCLTTAAFVCLLFPIGTILGVFTFVVLSKSEVKAMFDRIPRD